MRIAASTTRANKRRRFFEMSGRTLILFEAVTIDLNLVAVLIDLLYITNSLITLSLSGNHGLGQLLLNAVGIVESDGQHPLSDP